MANTEQENNCGLCLVVETAAGADVHAHLADALAHRVVETVIIAAAADQTLDAQSALSLVALCRAANCPVLIRNDANLARVVKADGVHLTWSDKIQQRVQEAREVLGQHGVIGADAGRSRHDAMTLGESGVEYIAFGIPETVKDKQTAKERRAGFIEWWAEIFVIPCMAFNVETLDDAAELSDAGADFVALKFPAGLSAADTQSWLTKVEQALSQPAASTCEV